MLRYGTRLPEARGAMVGEAASIAAEHIRPKLP